MRVMYFGETLCFYKAHHMTFLSTLSYAFSRSIKSYVDLSFAPYISLHPNFLLLVQQQPLYQQIAPTPGWNPWLDVG
jgi:hypothetical protein